MTLRAQLLDAAVSTAKAYEHGTVEPRHVFFVIAKRFRDRSNVHALIDRTRAMLEPHGTAHGTPQPSADTTTLLDGINSEDDAVAALVKAFAGSSSDAGVTTSREQVAQAAAPSAVSSPAAAAPAKAETTADVLAELDGLIGLAAVKAQVRSVIAVVQANIERTKAGLKPVNPSLHLVFTGAPGTGKTTVARLVARLYASIGALPGAGFTEVTRADLIAGYVGQTALKTTDVIRRTRPGVLFIDEAYALTPRSDVDFGTEAIATIVKAMEDYRDELAVIVAGYTDEMADFVNSNPGLRSRFKTYIQFPDYTPSELLQIFERFSGEVGITLDDVTREQALRVLAEAVGRQAFGNARFVRSMFEQAYARMAARAASDGVVSVSELLAILPTDVTLDDEALRRERRKIGFGGKE